MYPPRFYEIVREALKDAPDSVVAVVPDDVLYKFARLIAEECADIAMNHRKCNSPDDSHQRYNELTEYGMGCEDTAVHIAHNLKFLFR
jgi:hypothetical protein